MHGARPRAELALGAVDDEPARLHSVVELVDGKAVRQAQHRDGVRFTAGVGERLEAQIGEYPANAQAALSIQLAAGRDAALLAELVERGLEREERGDRGRERRLPQLLEIAPVADQIQ